MTRSTRPSGSYSRPSRRTAPSSPGPSALAASAVGRPSRRLFAPLPPSLRRTLTLDRGREFTGHAALARKNGLRVYFADPYAAWQRGTNENTNGLVRQYFPEGTDFTQVSHQALRQVARELNDRPRKRLHYHTPREVLQRHFPGCI